MNKDTDRGLNESLITDGKKDIGKMGKMTIEEKFEIISGLQGQKSVLQPEREVWIPAIANGGFLGVLKELEKRGWKIEPPVEKI